MTEPRPMRICDTCGQIDDHPRHVVALDSVAPDARPEVVSANVARVVEADLPTEDKVRIIAEIQDTSVLQRHMDCCASVGCPDGLCDQVVAAHPGLTGPRLINAITKGM